MEHKVYRTESITVFEYQFVSVGPKGHIFKRIRFDSAFKHEGMFNLSLHDVDKTGRLSDTVVSNNGDHRIIFTTIAITILEFLKHFPQGHVVFSGNTASRTRLYRIAISNNLNELKRHFRIYGLLNGAWQSFD